MIILWSQNEFCTILYKINLFSLNPLPGKTKENKKWSIKKDKKEEHLLRIDLNYNDKFRKFEILFKIETVRIWKSSN